MALQWLSADLLTGRIIADLPSFDPSWPIKRTISAAESATGTLHLAGAPENWERAILDGGAQLACYDDTDPAQAILWGGIVWTAGPLDTASDDVPLALATYESVLDRAFVGDTTYTTTDHRDDIIADLITSWFTPNTGITVQLDYTAGNGPTPVQMDSPPSPGDAIVMQNTDNATVKTRMDQVFAQLGGEYTVELGWSADRESIVPTLRFGDRIGVAAPAGMAPSVTFEIPGTLISLQQMRDYSQGQGANKVVPYSSGQGSTTPYAAPILAPLADGRPTLEFRYQPAPSISPAALTQYGKQAIGILAPGARPITLLAALARIKGRRLGTDWLLGDDVGYRCAPGVAPAFPNGVDDVGRSIGYALTDSTIAPVLADPKIFVQGG